MTETLHTIQKKMKEVLDGSRYNHTIGVMDTAACLAMRYGADLEKAMTAGLLHDCAKCISNDEKLRLCKMYHLEVSASENANPGLLHAKLGAYLAHRIYGVSDPEILDAIAVHTTGRPAMTLLDKIIYIADFIEPGRDQAPNLSDVRALAFTDLDACLNRILVDTLTYLKKRGGTIDPATEATCLYYRTCRAEE